MNINPRVREIIEEDMTLRNAPEKVADLIAHDLTADEHAELFAVMLRDRVRSVLAEERRSLERAGRGQATHVTQDMAAPASAKLDARREYLLDRYRKAISHGVDVGGELKTLSECTREDILAVVSTYEARAAANTAQAVRFRNLHSKMVANDCDTVECLPADEFFEAMS